MAHKLHDHGPWEPLRALKRKLRARQNHPHYVGNGNESLRLNQLIEADPPQGGMAAYLQYLSDDDPQS